MRIDCHNDTVGFLAQSSTLASLPQAHLDYQRFRKYLDAAFFAIFIDQQQFADRLTEEFTSRLESLIADIQLQPGLSLLTSARQLDAPDVGLILLSLEGAAPLGAKAEHLASFFAHGLRSVGLTWNYDTAYAGGARGKGGGLTAAGRRLVADCNARGILLDAAHSSSATFADLLKYSSQPIIDSHTTCGVFGNQWGRAVSDDELRALAACGGVACITFVADFLGEGGGVERLCQHIEYAVDLVGSEHIGLGADYDGADLHPELAGLEFRPALLRRLRERGMNEADVRNVEGESVRRLLRRVLPT